MITAKLLKLRIDNLNLTDGIEPGQPLEYILNIAYGGYRVCQTHKDGHGLDTLSDRGTAKETAIWLDGFTAARLMAREAAQ